MCAKIKFNPAIHHRHSLRLRNYDYSQPGRYYITICCQDRICRFGYIENNKMVLNEFGQIAFNEWLKLPDRFPNFKLDIFQIMPDHIHAIICLITKPGAEFTSAPEQIKQPEQGKPLGFSLPTVGDIVGAYKSLVFNGCLKLSKSKNQPMGKLWQRNYHERIIHDYQSYMIISEYIINNPARWTNK